MAANRGVIAKHFILTGVLRVRTELKKFAWCAETSLYPAGAVKISDCTVV